MQEFDNSKGVGGACRLAYLADEGDMDSDENSEEEFGLAKSDKYVSFDEKVKFSDQLKKCSREQLTAIIKVFQEEQSEVVEDLGQDKLQIRLDALELDTYIKCQQILKH